MSATAVILSALPVAAVNAVVVASPLAEELALNVAKGVAGNTPAVTATPTQVVAAAATVSALDAIGPFAGGCFCWLDRRVLVV